MNSNYYAEVKAHFNEPILLISRLARVVGYTEDLEDCYIIYKDMGSEGYKYHSFVGGYTYLDRLKGQDSVISNSGEYWDDFIRLDNLLTLNGCPPEKDFVVA